jgi:hypothetical protein
VRVSSKADQGNTVFVAYSVGSGSSVSHLRNGFGCHLEADYTLLTWIHAATETLGGQQTRTPCHRTIAEAPGFEFDPRTTRLLGWRKHCLAPSERHPSRVTKLILVDAQIHDSPPNGSFQQRAAKRKNDAVSGLVLTVWIDTYKNPPTTDDNFMQILVKARSYHSLHAAAVFIDKNQSNFSKTPARLWAFLRQSACDSKPEDRLPHIRSSSCPNPC